jgi:hypothetical protein
MSRYPDPLPPPPDSHLEHAVKAASQYDAGYRGMAIEILALRRAVRFYAKHEHWMSTTENAYAPSQLLVAGGPGTMAGDGWEEAELAMRSSI